MHSGKMERVEAEFFLGFWFFGGLLISFDRFEFFKKYSPVHKTIVKKT